MQSYTPDAKEPGFSTLSGAFADDSDLPFSNLLQPEDLERRADKHNFRGGRIYTPAILLWAFLSQCLGASKSCVAATARVIVLCAASGFEPPSANNGGYCKARKKIPVPFIQELSGDIARRLTDQVPNSWQFHNRPVRLVDGTTVTGPDTVANQAKYPQPKSQKKGLGFPMIRLVVVICLVCAVLLDARYTQWSGKETGETALLRQMFGTFQPGDIVLADRCHCTYPTVASLLNREADGCFRLHQRRTSIAKSGKVLGKGDFLGYWTRPTEKPKWMSAEEYLALPERIEIREVHFEVKIRGFRVEKVIVATTLTDHTRYTKEEIEELYRKRWHVELDLRYIKATLKMDRLEGQTPEMMHREIWGHFLGYNLVRRLMMQAAVMQNCTPLDLSFKSALEQVREGFTIRSLSTGTMRKRLGMAMVVAAGQNRVGKRPNRSEPRAAKWRGKGHKVLTVPRGEARAQLEQNQGAETPESDNPKNGKGNNATPGKKGKSKSGAEKSE